MSNTPFEQLCAEFCSAAGTRLAGPQAAASPQGFTARLHDTPITVMATDHEGAPGVHLLLEFGLPPRPHEAATWQALLDANFAMLGRHGLCFSREPQSGQVMLQFHAPLAGMTGEALLAQCGEFAQLAGNWRRGDIHINAASAPAPGQTPEANTAMA